MVRYFVLCFLMMLIASPVLAATDDGVIGTILEVEGSATITPADGTAASPAAVNKTVHLSDAVKTAPASRVFILFIDNTELTLSENTQVKIDRYVFDPDDNTNNKASYSVMEGAFQYVSGLIGKKENPDVHIETPVGSICIRGTDFWAGNIDNQYGVAVNEGRVALKTDAGEEVVNKGEGTQVQDRHSRPARAQVWTPEKFQRVASTVKLRRHDQIRRRIRSMGNRQRILQRHYKEYNIRRNSGASGLRERKNNFRNRGSQQKHNENRYKRRQRTHREGQPRVHLRTRQQEEEKNN